MEEQERIIDLLNILKRFKELNPNIDGREARRKYNKKYREENTKALNPYERKEKKSPKFPIITTNSLF